MKKLVPNLLLVLTLVFAAFTCGFFLGRNFTHGDVQLASLSLPALSAGTPSTAASSEPVDTTQPSETTAPPSADTVSTSARIPEETEASQSSQALTEPLEETTAATTAGGSTGLININTASAAALTALPGIGDVLAQRIVDYREANGPFRTVAELTKVKGIGEKKLEAILDLITV